MMSRPARFYHSANLEGRGSSRKFETRLHKEIRSEQEKNFGRGIYASETIQNCNNPTGHIDTLKLSINIVVTVHNLLYFVS